MTTEEHKEEHKEEYNIVFSFDTTGSMSGCIGGLKNKIKDIINELFENIPNISIGVISHGDYCDEKTSYLMKHVDITKDKESLINFVKEVGNTGGGDFPEAYEYVLREVQKFSWTSNSMRALVMIGDATPHEKNENPYKIDWRHEIKEIKELGINIYSVQCLNSGSASVKTFYKQMAMITNGYHLYLDQFSYITEMMKAICYKQMGTEKLENYEQSVKESDNLKGLNKVLRDMFDVMLNRTTIEEIDKSNEEKYDWASSKPKRTRKSTKADTVDYTTLDESEFTMKPSRPSRFQVLDVTEDTVIKDFVRDHSLVFQTGKGFYEFTKPELIQKTKEIILLNKSDGLFYEGLKARKLMNLVDYDASKKIKPTKDITDLYTIFIQSTSHSRKLICGTKFLYDTTDDVSI
jgi:hypothetical protein